MPVICWGALGKSANDPTTIDEQIDADILAHNAELTAHGLSGYAVYNHRADDPLDHPDETVTNAKILAMARAHTVIVDAGGEGDYTDIQDAIDFVHGLGGGSILIRDGTYTSSVNIDLESNISIKGETPLGAKVIFDAINQGFSAIGDSSPYSTGTISINNDSTSVVGVGTNWDPEASAGQYIRINNRWFEIETVVDDTHITLIEDYRGVDISGDTYEIATMKTDIEVEGLSIEGDGFNPRNIFDYTVRATFRNMHRTGGQTSLMILKHSKDTAILESDGFKIWLERGNQYRVLNNATLGGTGVIMRYCRDGYVNNNIINVDGNPAISMLDSDSMNVSDNKSRTNGGNCIEMIGCNFNTIEGNYAIDGYTGVSLSGCSYNRIVNNSVEEISTVGIRLLSTSIHNTISNNTVKGAGTRGIYVTPSCDFNIVKGNNLSDIGGAGTYSAIEVYNADSNVVSGNICKDSTESGIKLDSSDRNVISHNQCLGNTEYGIQLTSGASDYNIVTSNQLAGNTIGALDDNGDFTVDANNIKV